MKKEKLKIKKRKNSYVIGESMSSKLFVIAMLFLPLLYTFCMWVFVRFNTIFLAFQDKNGNLSLSNFYSTDIYQQTVWTLIFGKTGNFRYCLLNTCKYFFPTEFIGVPISLVLSYFIYKQIWGYKYFRFVFYLPKIIMGIVLATAVSQFLARGGAFEKLCSSIGIKLPELGLLRTPATATWTMVVWGILVSACSNILFYGAMGRVPPEVIEVGKLEGITLMQELIHVILPLIWSTLSMTLVLDFAGFFNCTGDILLFGIEDLGVKEVYTVNYWFFKQVYGGYGTINNLGNYGLMSAMGLVITAVAAPLALFVRWLGGKFDVEY